MSLSSVKWICIGAAGVAFVVGYHFWYVSRRRVVYDLDKIEEAYRYLERFGLDYGSSMADNYYHGYLQIILPGLSDRVKEYKLRHKFKFDLVFPDKIFIIVHKSGFSPDTYEKGNNRFWSQVNLEHELEGRNGIRKRKYQSSVYRVTSQDNSESIRVVMEGVPCLRQVYDSSKINKSVRDMYDAIIDTFMKKLTEKIEENEECRGKCELIYFDDGPEAASTGKGGYSWLAEKIFQSVKFDPLKYGL